MSLANEISYDAAAEHVGMRPSAFRKLVRNGEGPKARRDGRTLKFRPDHLDEWAKEYGEKAYSTDAGRTTPKAKTPKAKTGGTKKRSPLD